MTVVGQHPGYEAPAQSAGARSPLLRILLIVLAVALGAGVGYLVYEAASDEPVAEPPTTFERYPSHEMVQQEIDAARLSMSGPSSVDQVQAEVDLARLGLAGPSSVEIVQQEISGELRRRSLANASYAEAWGAPFLAERFGGDILYLETEAASGPTPWGPEFIQRRFGGGILYLDGGGADLVTEAWER